MLNYTYVVRKYNKFQQLMFNQMSDTIYKKKINF